MTPPTRSGELEITDLLWPVDDGGDRLPVMRDQVISLLLDRSQRRAARLVARMPHHNGLVDETYLDAVGLRVHYELQRLGQELQLDRRVATLLVPPIRRLLSADDRPVRVVDLGCGLGHVIRTMAAHGYLPAGVELVGVDLNPTLINEARRLAEMENLDCEFVFGDAFAPGVAIIDPGRTIVVSTGVLHHLGDDELEQFFALHADLGIAGFAHWDIAPCLWSTLGAWVFHQARMREPVSRHDGVLSARRAHSARTLLDAARPAADYAPVVLEGSRWHPRALDVLRPITGWRG